MLCMPSYVICADLMDEYHVKCFGENTRIIVYNSRMYCTHLGTRYMYILVATSVENFLFRRSYARYMVDLITYAPVNMSLID